MSTADIINTYFYETESWHVQLQIRNELDVIYLINSWACKPNSRPDEDQLRGGEGEIRAQYRLFLLRIPLTTSLWDGCGLDQIKRVL